MKKHFKKIVSLALVLILVCSLSAVAFADQVTTRGSFKMMNFNVAGLPDYNILFGEKGRDVSGAQKLIGAKIIDVNPDIAMVQEDFNYHVSLETSLMSYKYVTKHSGGVPVGDGLNAYSKYPIYNVERIEWRTRAGVMDDGCDELTPKGILHCVAEIAENVYVDLYDIHADAYGGEASIAARRDNFNQLADLINSRIIDRPVIVTGDFNAMIEGSGNDGLVENLIVPCGLKDAWVELYNHGDYSDFSSFVEQYGNSWESKWGVWDSIERFLYKDGGGIMLNATSYTLEKYEDETIGELSDHPAAIADFEYVVVSASDNIGADLYKEVPNFFTRFAKQVYHFMHALTKIIANWSDVMAFLQGGAGQVL
ncbi:MAG: endonuclease/exonuclease/phosphatase family protein [Clostridiales bacterium]|nr:endonuclease/exonuclease/phosphatase family protein [Clostridiales bacterium]